MEKESLLHNISQGSNLPLSRFFFVKLEFSTPEKPGQVIQTSTQITAHHKGFVEFKLCPRNDETMTGDELQVFHILQLQLPLFLAIRPRNFFWC